MTYNEARERAKAIWSTTGGTMTVRLRPDGGADVELADGITVDLGSNALTYHYHRLDRHGHVACHDLCARREKALQSPPPVAPPSDLHGGEQ